MLIGIPVGVISALRPPLAPRPRGHGARARSAISAPVYWLGLVSLFLFASDIGKVHLFGGAGSYVPLTQDPRRLVPRR